MYWRRKEKRQCVKETEDQMESCVWGEGREGREVSIRSISIELFAHEAGLVPALFTSRPCFLSAVPGT